MNPYVPGEQPRAAGIVKLNTNENPYPPSPRVADVLEGFDASDLNTYPNPDCAELRQRIAELHGVDVEQVIVGNGSDELLALCTRAFVEDDGAVGAFDLTYSLYPVLADIRAVQFRTVPLGEGFQWLLPDETTFSLFFLANPNAPTGMGFAIEDVRMLCERVSGVVVIDEAYVDFADGDCLSLVSEFDNVIVTRTLSKAYSLAGLRLGYAIGCRELIAALMTIKDSYNVNRLTQDLALAALSDVEHMRENCERICKTRRRIHAELSDMGFEVFESQANFLWVKPPRVDAQELFEDLRKAAIVVRYFPGEQTGSYLRISVGTDQEMNAFLDAVRDVLVEDAYKG
jgi:histidinol-phosphate aminotransferase